MDRELMMGQNTVADVQHLLIAKPTLITKDQSMLEVIKAIVQDPRTRQVYVVDKEGKLEGSVGMDSIIEYMFPFTAVMERNSELLTTGASTLSARTAGDLMNATPVSVTPNTLLCDVARLLMHEKLSELPVLDAQKRVTGQLDFQEIMLAFIEYNEQTVEED